MPKLIPQGTVVVYRDGKALQVPPNGQAFDFTEQEVDEVKRGNPNMEMFMEAKTDSVMSVNDPAVQEIPKTPALSPEQAAIDALQKTVPQTPQATIVPGKPASKAELAKSTTGTKDDASGDVL